MTNRLMAIWLMPRTRKFHVALMSLGLILWISMRWLHHDFLSGFGIGVAIAAGLYAAAATAKSRGS